MTGAVTNFSISTIALEYYCLIKFRDRTHYKRSPLDEKMIKSDLEKIVSKLSFASLVTSKEIMEKYQYKFPNPETINVREYESLLYVCRDGTETKLLLVLGK